MVTLRHSVMQVLLLCWELLVSNPCSLGSLAPPLPCKLTSSQDLRVGLGMAWGEVGHRLSAMLPLPVLSRPQESCCITSHHVCVQRRKEGEGRRDCTSRVCVF